MEARKSLLITNNQRFEIQLSCSGHSHRLTLHIPDSRCNPWPQLLCRSQLAGEVQRCSRIHVEGSQLEAQGFWSYPGFRLWCCARVCSGLGLNEDPDGIQYETSVWVAKAWIQSSESLCVESFAVSVLFRQAFRSPIRITTSDLLVLENLLKQTA